MPPETKKYLEDIAQAAELIAQFTAGKTFADYMQDPMLRAAAAKTRVDALMARTSGRRK